MTVAVSSCEKVIDVDLNSADPQTVFEANLAEGEDSLWFSLTQTADYFGNEEPPFINGAEIDFTDSEGNVMRAQAMGDGQYLVTNVKAKSEGTYKVKVNLDGQITEAESYMPKQVLLDSIQFEYQPANDFVDESYSINIAFQDPGDQVNYYQIIVRVNGEVDGNLNVFDDRFNQGRYVNAPLFGYEIAEGDIVEVELQNIDADIYEYYVTLASILSQTGPPGIAPGNPITNLKGDIQLGFFGTYSYSSIKDTVL